MIEDLDGEIARLQAEIRSVERAPPSFGEAWPTAERQRREAEAVFRRVGPLLEPNASPLPELVHQRCQSAIGAAMVAGGKALIDAERIRVKAATAGGLSIDDRARKLDELRQRILRACAQRELALRKVEQPGEFQPRPTHPELAIMRAADVEALAAAR